MATLLSKFILLILLTLMIKIPLESVFLSAGFSDFDSKQLAGIPSRIIIIILTIYFIFKNKLSPFSNTSTPFRIRNIQAAIIALTIFTYTIYSNLGTYQSVNFSSLSYFIVGALFIGLAEEMAFRGFIFPILIKRTQNISLSMLLSSLLFGLIHYVNLIRQPENIAGINSQVVFAFSIGMFFCGVVMRTNNIYLTGLLHALFNLAFGAGELKMLLKTNVDEQIATGTSDLKSTVATLILFGLIAISGVVMARLEDQQRTLKLVLHQ